LFSWAPFTLRDAVFSRVRIDQIAVPDTPLSRFFVRIVSTTLEFDESVGIAGSTHPDSLTAAIALHPRLVTAAGEYGVSVETSSELTRGYASMSWGVHGIAPNATVIESVDAEGFFACMAALLSAAVTPSRAFLHWRFPTGFGGIPAW